MKIGEFKYDPQEGTLSRGEEITRLRSKSQEMLEIFRANPGEILSTEQFLESIWDDTHTNRGVVSQCIRELRQALADDVKAPKFIKTIPKKGYIWLDSPESKPTTRAKTRPWILALILTLLLLGLMTPFLPKKSIPALKQAFLQGQFVQVKEELHTILEKNPNHLQARILLANTCFARGQLEEAQAQLQLSQLENNTQALLLLAHVRFLQGNLLATEKILAEILRLAPMETLKMQAKMLRFENQCVLGEKGEPPNVESQLSSVDHFFYSAREGKNINNLIPREQLQVLMDHYQEQEDIINQIMTFRLFGAHETLPSSQRLSFLNDGIKLAIRINHKVAECQIYYSMANLNLQRGNLTEAINQYRKSMQLADTMGARLLTVKADIMITRALFHQAEIDNRKDEQLQDLAQKNLQKVLALGAKGWLNQALYNSLGIELWQNHDLNLDHLNELAEVDQGPALLLFKNRLEIMNKTFKPESLRSISPSNETERFLLEHERLASNIIPLQEKTKQLEQRFPGFLPIYQQRKLALENLSISGPLVLFPLE